LLVKFAVRLPSLCFDVDRQPHSSLVNVVMRIMTYKGQNAGIEPEISRTRDTL